MQYLKKPHRTVALVHISPTSDHAAQSETGLGQSLDTNCIVLSTKQIPPYLSEK